MREQLSSANFGFLATHDAQLVRLGALAERYFKDDPNTCLLKLRQYGETLAQLVAAKSGLFRDPQEAQADLLRRLKFDRVVPQEAGDLFHHLRVVGNKATHENDGTHAEALTALMVGRELGIWFHRTFGPSKTFKPGPFIPPPDPHEATDALREELSRLRSEVDSHKSAAERAKTTAAEHERARLSAEERARKEREDRTVWEQIAAEAEQAKAALAKQLDSLQAAAAQAPAKATAAIVAKAEAAATEINIDEASTRALIDEQLRARGWEVDTQTMRHGAGTRPARGRNMAIAEWPTKSGPADYALFVGTHVGAIFLLARWGRSWWRIRKARQSSTPLDLPFPLPVRAVAGRIEPGVFGVFRPVLLLPRGLADHLSPSQLEAILAHERCHVRRRDNLSAAIQMAVEVLFWFHPAVWWIETRLVEERERACDEAVLASRGEPLSYAEGILNVCKFYVEAPLTCMSGVTGSDLKKRIVRVMSQHRGRPLGAGKKIVLAIAALIAVALPLSFGMVRPVHAHAQTPAKPNHSIVGTWQGTLHAPHHDLRTVLKIKENPAGKLTAMFYSIDQSGRGIETSSTRFKDGVLQYAIDMIDLKYTGRMSADGNSISGTSKQMGHDLPLVFERATPETAWTIPPPPPKIALMAADAKPGIEVATINPTKPGTTAKLFTVRGTNLVTEGTTPDDLIKFGYNVQNKQIANGPGWMSSEKFDINAKPNVPGMPSSEQLKEMVKAILADRFQLKKHTEQKTMSAYVLSVAKGGPKMTKDNSKGDFPGLLFGPPTITLRVRDATMKDFRNALQSAVLDRPVVNHTGLTGHWDFTLHWTPDASQFIGMGWKMPPPKNSAKAAPPLFTAIREQLGLELGAEKTSVPVLVVDHVDHPSAN